MSSERMSHRSGPEKNAQSNIAQKDAEKPPNAGLSEGRSSHLRPVQGQGGVLTHSGMGASGMASCSISMGSSSCTCPKKTVQLKWVDILHILHPHQMAAGDQCSVSEDSASLRSPQLPMGFLRVDRLMQVLAVGLVVKAPVPAAKCAGVGVAHGWGVYCSNPPETGLEPAHPGLLHVCPLH